VPKHLSTVIYFTQAMHLCSCYTSTAVHNSCHPLPAVCCCCCCCRQPPHGSPAVIAGSSSVPIMDGASEHCTCSATALPVASSTVHLRCSRCCCCSCRCPLYRGLPIPAARAAGQMLLLLLLVQPTAGLAAAAAAAAKLHSLTINRSHAPLMSIAARRHASPILTLPFTSSIVSLG
jgi:hypothetical protein